MQFTQFLRPYGHKQTIDIERSADVEDMARWLKRRGCLFEAEAFPDGKVHFEILDPFGPIDDEPAIVSCELVQNGPAVLEAIDRLVRRAWSVLDHESTK